MTRRKIHKGSRFTKKTTKSKRTKRTKRTYKKTRTVHKRYNKVGGVYIDPNYGATNPYPFVDPHD